ncbi:hypothetical protein GCM10027176_34660 [Actinoallomurus bryophytorum]
MADQVAHVAHLNARDTTLVFASRAPQPDIERVKARMGWTMPWYTMTDGFDADLGVDEWHGTNAFIRALSVRGEDRPCMTMHLNAYFQHYPLWTETTNGCACCGRRGQWICGR